MDDLVAFLRARLDEDEEIARAATPGPWKLGGIGAHVVLDGPRTGHEAEYGNVAGLMATQGNIQAEIRNAEHIARHDPARVLREVEAKRRIVDRYEDAITRLTDPAESSPAARAQVEEYEQWTLPALGLAWVDHPDYRPEWKP